MTEVLRGTVVTPSGVIDDGVVALADGLIAEVGPAAAFPASTVPAPSERVYLPGMIDVHCHGGGGFGFPDSDEAGARAAAAHHRGRGTTTLLASLVSAAPEKLLERIATLAPLVDDGTVAGLHLEGPFLAQEVCGAQDPRYIIDGDPALLATLLDAAGGRIRSMTVAAETAHFAVLARQLSDAGAVVSVGHTAGDYDTVAAALGTPSGPVSITHLFNGMHPMHHRHPGAVGAALRVAGEGRAVAEIIGDGVHLASGTVAMVFATVGPDHIALVSDAMQAAGMPDGQYSLGPLEVTVGGGVARLTTSDGTQGSIAGGTSSVLDVAVRAVRHSGVPLADAVRAGATTPARLLGLKDRGELAAGLRADVLELSAELELLRVLRGGAAG
ncbi:N-acetylglucosamine-6-phosphate deacetylase [Tsukamurella pulmonis]|uniref:N-acetylglucosamine 6-phosphate deacetylase n=1 Tax=Tsukamurella pulmonis TaxID=47312 RepID=A0A1H1HDQ3_9ACTN|nr:amidohydrolase family protein [Tsukamurella pulmonis]KXO94846.1 N-acetylglucosamine-6-phosphate deacetylase [Tsukamurella pulmonis]KXP12874.1 N-acetylglucosamine-6-phosphate deacetylase [Tsukamurella pulmonis]RDH11710.1 N-acetylglucosamine-6-phosphate deacetylase [Tsukamurella pulmonis]SDR23146.1 N-acetylglucosamine 6-phosphate deacetylase [Tsukamurella pulmonis]SUP15199.1 N-acetylglucosamine-6-phosphate deacetylase [Tsukamurella pulmonis]